MLLCQMCDKIVRIGGMPWPNTTEATTYHAVLGLSDKKSCKESACCLQLMGFWSDLFGDIIISDLLRYMLIDPENLI